jgi:hypothetical protein
MNSSAPYSQGRSERNSSDGNKSPPRMAEGEDAGERQGQASAEPDIAGRYNTDTKAGNRRDSRGTNDHHNQTETEQYTSFPPTKSMASLVASAESLEDKRSLQNDTGLPDHSMSPIREESMTPVREVLAETHENVLQEQE